MTKRRLTLLSLVTLGVLVAAGCGGGGTKVPNDAVAVVAGQTVPRAELDQLLDRARATYKQQRQQFPQVGTSQYQALQQQIVAFLVRREEYEQQAKKLNVVVTPADVDKRVKQVMRQFFAGNEKRFADGIKAQGYTTETFRRDISSQILSEKLVAALTKNVKVTDADVSTYYRQNLAQFSVPESRTVRHILVKTKPEADRIYSQLQQGASFAALAKKYSLDPGSKNKGGQLTIQRGQTVAPFDQTAFLLKAGQLSRPVKTQFGWHVIEPVSAVTPGRTRPLAAVSAGIRTTLVGQKRQGVLQAWIASVNKIYAKKVNYAAGYAPPNLNPPTTTQAPSGGGHQGGNGNG